MLKLLILDFDDTLFPSTVYKINPDIDKRYLNDIDNLVCELVISYLDKDFVVCVITNSQADWFKMISEKHLPKFYKFAQLTNIGVISARDNYSTAYPLNFVNWKINAFRDYAFHQLINNYPKENNHNEIREVYILSIGDSDLDMIATIQLRQCDISQLCKLNTKFIKLENMPNIEMLITQLRYIIQNIETFDYKLSGPNIKTDQNFPNYIDRKQEELQFEMDEPNFYGAPERQNMDISKSLSLPLQSMEIFFTNPAKIK